MLFSEYYQIMKDHGIGELIFRYNNEIYGIIMYIKGLNLKYLICGKKSFSEFNKLDDLVYEKYFDGKCLKDIWQNIEIIAIEEETAEEFNADQCFNYITYLAEQGELQWSYFGGHKKSFLLQFKYALYPCLVCAALGAIFPLFKLANWNTIIFFGGIALFALTIAVIAFCKNKLDINYQITEKGIYIDNGISLSTTYDNIKKVKLKRSLFNKSIGTIKIYPRKGLAINYRLEWIPEPEKVYNIILENINKSKQLQ